MSYIAQSLCGCMDANRLSEWSLTHRISGSFDYLLWISELPLIDLVSGTSTSWSHPHELVVLLQERAMVLTWRMNTRPGLLLLLVRTTMTDWMVAYRMSYVAWRLSYVISRMSSVS